MWVLVLVGAGQTDVLFLLPAPNEAAGEAWGGGGGVEEKARLFVCLCDRRQVEEERGEVVGKRG